jgi:hypothetical protein
VPSLCSLLSVRIVPPEGGATEFASARCAYPSRPDATRYKRLMQRTTIGGDGVDAVLD